MTGRSPEIGAKLFAEATCAQCHKVNGQGGAVGPARTLLLVTLVAALAFLAVQVPALLQLLATGHQGLTTGVVDGHQRVRRMVVNADRKSVV